MKRFFTHFMRIYNNSSSDLDKLQFNVHSGRGLEAREESRFSAN